MFFSVVGNVWGLVTDFFLLVLIHLLSSFCLLKLQKTESKKTGILLNSIFILGFYEHFVVGRMFSWTSRNNLVFRQGVRGISGIILANCESSISSIRGLRIILTNCGFEDLPWVFIFSRYIQLTLLQAGDTMHCLARGLSKYVCSNWLSREKGTSTQSYVKGTGEGFLFSAR